MFYKYLAPKSWNRIDERDKSKTDIGKQLEIFLLIRLVFLSPPKPEILKVANKK